MSSIHIISPKPQRWSWSHAQHRHRPDSAPPWPTPGSKYYRPSTLTAASRLDAWIVSASALTALPDPSSCSPVSPPSDRPSDRPSTCPAILDVSKGKRRTPPSFATIIKHMAPAQEQQRRLEGEPTSSNDTSATITPSGRVGTRHALYRNTLEDNFVYVDYLGVDNLPSPLKTFVSTKILNSRESPQLSDEAVAKVRRQVAELASAEPAAMEQLLHSDMFPCMHSDIAKGGLSQWNTAALPNNPKQQYSLSAPKPDAHFGYGATRRSGGWTEDQRAVLDHPVTRPYTQPTNSNAFPFLMVEMKSEAFGGSPFVAENQAAGSGAHSVKAISWLLQQAGTYDSVSLTDKIAFSITLSPRLATFYLHWRSEADRCYYMSYIMSYSPLVAGHIRECNNTVKNIIEYGLGTRKTTIGAALEALFPLPEHWKQFCSTASKRTRSITPTIAAPEVQVQEQEGEDVVMNEEVEEQGNDDKYQDEEKEEEVRPKKKLKLAEGKKTRVAKGKKR